MGLGKRLKLFLTINNTRQKALGELLDVTAQNVSSILKEKSNLTLHHLEKIAKNYSELNIRWLLTGQGEMFSFNDKNMDTNAVEDQQETNYGCKDCKKLREKIRSMEEKLDDKQELLDFYRGKKETPPGGGVQDGEGANRRRV